MSSHENLSEQVVFDVSHPVLVSVNEPSPEYSTAPSEVPTLSPREAATLHWLSLGNSNKEIAQALDISPHTVRCYVARLMQKLRAANRAQVVTRAFALRLLSVSAQGEVCIERSPKTPDKSPDER
jgi:DNA-binding CsgD family transcriptional regulator